MRESDDQKAPGNDRRSRRDGLLTGAAAAVRDHGLGHAPRQHGFFDWNHSSLSQQALYTIKQAASSYKAGVIAVTGHTDRPGPESYNMALSLRRANAVKEALVRDGVPESAITIVGKGETQPLIPTADNVREPQNRRVEIVPQ
jgi:outer membrane protein OmpA-like peptidoglycan-associated protein